jgi:hypothetical protein
MFAVAEKSQDTVNLLVMALLCYFPWLKESRDYRNRLEKEQRKNLIELTETIWFHVQVIRKANQSNGSSAAGKKAI